MPMIDIVAPEGTFPAASEATLLEQATTCLLHWEKATGIPIATANTGAYLHVLPAGRVNAGGKPARVVRVEVLTPAQALSQEQRAGITAGLTALVAEAAGDASLRERTWILFREAVDGGWGIGGRAFTNADIGEAVRASAAHRTPAA